MSVCFEARVFHCVSFLKPQIEPEGCERSNCKSPGQPYVKRSGCVNYVSSAFAILVAHQEFGAQNGGAQPAQTAFDLVDFAGYSAPRLRVLVAFTVSHCAECKPEEQSCDGEEVFGRNEEGVKQEEVVEEVNEQEALLVANNAELLVTGEYLPLPHRSLVFAAQPVVLADASPP